MTPSHDDCTRCPLVDGRERTRASRRDFLRHAAAAAASLGCSVLLPRVVAALPLRAGQPRNERRYPIPATDGVLIDADNSAIIARAGGRAWCFSLACPHQNTALRWDQDDGEFRCPKHKSRYRRDGSFIDGRATRPMDRLAIQRDATSLIVDLDTLLQQDEHPAEWAAAFVTV